jgi:ligand-binding sensor domain-containing protein
MKEGYDGAVHMNTQKILGLILLSLLFLVGCFPFAIGDPAASGKVFVWFDENANGVVDDGEKPIPRVKVGIGYPSAYTDQSGKASVGRFGCDSNCWKRESIYVEVPQGFKPTTPIGVPLTGPDGKYQFGFALDPSIPTATPYSAHLTCKNYPGVRAEDVTIASDGSLWFGLPDGVAEYDAQSDQFILHDGLQGLYDNVYVGKNKEIWIAEQEYNISRYFNSEWLTYGKDSLITASDIAFGETSADLIWFARQAPPDSIISFNKKNGNWQYFTQSNNLEYVIGQKVRISTDGSTWFAAFDDRSQKTTPVSDKKIQWQIYDLHIFTKQEIFQTPDFGWIEDSQVAPDGTIWLVTTEGLARFNHLTNNWKIYEWPRSDDIQPSIVSSSMAISPDGSIWVGTSSLGKPLALRYTPDSNNGVWDTYDDRDGLPDIDNLTITPDNKMWFGSGLASKEVVGCNLLKH